MKQIQKVLILIKSIDRKIWVLVISAFILGLLIPSGSDEIITQEAHDSHNHAQEWTCSMHPQVKLPEAGQCPICFMDLIPLESGSETIAADQLQLSEAAIALAEISTTPVIRGSAEREIRLSGKLAYDETRIKRMSAWMPGRLDRLFVDYTGTSVKKGEHLFEIYSPELYAAQEELVQANDQLNRLSQSDALSRRTFQATRSAAREKLKLLGLNANQIKSIESRGSASATQTVFSPISGIVIEKSALQGSYVETGSPIYTIADLDELWVILDAYESDLTWLNYGQKLTFEAEAFPGREFESIISFIDPVLDDRKRTVRIRANIKNSEGLLKPGMFVRAKIQSALDSDGVVISKELAKKWIGPMHPEIIRDKAGNCDICGMPLVPAESLGYVRGGAGENQPLIIPVSAVLKTGPRAIVYVRVTGVTEPTFELREVKLGPKTLEHYVVLEGLSEGEEVVTNGSFKIDSAMQIAAKSSMMNPQGGVSSTGHEHHGMGSVSNPMEEAVEDIEIDRDAMLILDPLFKGYFEMQEALAADNFESARSAARILYTSILSSKFTVTLDGHARESWDLIDKTLRSELEHLEHWSDLAELRRAFEPISQSMITLQKQFGYGGTGASYEVFCPMAFDNRGASWLQQNTTVNNPYFGASMLRCGEVRKEFASRAEMDQSQ